VVVVAVVVWWWDALFGLLWLWFRQDKVETKKWTPKTKKQKKKV